MIARGDLIEVVHNKISDAAKAQRMFLRRQELDFELFTPELVSGRQARDRLLGTLFRWYCGPNERAPFSQNEVEKPDAIKAIFGPDAVRFNVRQALKAARDSGDLVPSKQLAPNSKTPLTEFRDGFTAPGDEI